MDQSKKTMRHFYCRDVLWETFEQMANDFDCSIDYLVNEAMRYYARSKNYQSPGAPAMTAGQPNVGGGGGPANNSGPTSYPGGSKGPGGSGGPGGRPQPGTQPPPQPQMGMGGAAGQQARRPAPPTPGYAPTTTNNSGRGAPNGGMHAPAAQPAPPSSPPPNMGSG